MIPSKILFCTDFSENSESAGRCALEYAQAFGADLSVLHVIDTWAGLPAYEHGMPLNVEETADAMEADARARLSTMALEFGSRISLASLWVKRGTPAEEITRLAEEESVDLVVMGTHGWTGIKHVLLGSVAARVLRAAPCPVLVVKASEEKKAGR